MTGIEEAAIGSALLPELVPEAGMALGGASLLEPLVLGEIGSGASMLAPEMLGGLGGSAGLLSPLSATGSGFSMGNMLGMAGKGLLGMGQQQQGQAVAPPPRPQGQAPETSSQILGNRFAPQSLMQSSSQQQSPQMAQLLQALQGAGPMDPATLLKLRQQGIAI